MDWVALAAILTALTGWFVSMWKGRSEGAKIATEAALLAQTYYAGTIQHQSQRIEELADRFTAAEARWEEAERARATAEERAFAAEATVRAAYAWVEAGMPPPPFRWPAYVSTPPLRTLESEG